MPISRADVEHVARLARLALTDEELDRFQAQLSVILEEADKIRRLPTEGVPPTAHPLGMVSTQWRDDYTRIVKNRDDLMRHPVGPFLYTISCMHCMTVSLASGGAGLGAAWGEQTALAMLAEAGFGEVTVHEAPGDPTNAVFVTSRPLEPRP